MRSCLRTTLINFFDPLQMLTTIYIYIYIHVQVHLKKLEYREKVHFFYCNISKRETFIYSRFITCKVKHFKSFYFIFVLIWMIRAYSQRKSKIQYLKILEYLHLSFIKWPPLQYKFWVSLVLWNHNNGEDCWLGNDPEDEHWRPPQRR